MKKDTVEKLAIMIAEHKVDMSLKNDEITFQFLRILQDVKRAVEESGIVIDD